LPGRGVWVRAAGTAGPTPVAAAGNIAKMPGMADEARAIRTHDWCSSLPLRLLVYAVVLAAAAAALDGGVRLRRWAWDATTDVHFALSLHNAIQWGRYANQVGRVEVYDKLVETHGETGDFKGPAPFALDYPPLRLLIVQRWAAWADARFSTPGGPPVRWQNTWEFNRPMLRLNMACEMAAAAAMFLLVRHWVRRCAIAPPPKWAFVHWLQQRWRRWRGHQPGGTPSPEDTAPPDSRPPWHCGLGAGLLAAGLLWFNPAVIWNAHCFPQWDVWLLPSFLLAVYLCLRNWWLPAGVLVGIAAMAKGQILLVTPVILLWPLITMHFSAVLRMGIGLLLGMTLIASPWLVRTDAAWWFLAGTLVAAALTALLLLPLRAMPAWLSAVAGGALLLCVPLLGGSMAWYTVGLEYGTRHWKVLAWCRAANLGAILQQRYQWKWADTLDLADYLPLLSTPWVVEIRSLMIGGYVATLVLCAIALAWHARWHHRSFLFALTAPWVLMFALLPQMIDRYLVWAVATSAAVAAISMRGLLLHAALTVLAWMMMSLWMFQHARQAAMSQAWLKLVAGAYPDIGWAVITLAAVSLYLAIAPDRRRWQPLP